MALKTLTMVGAVMVSAMAMPAKAQEVCDGTLASGPWSLIAPNLGNACIGNITPAFSGGLALAAFDCSMPTGTSLIGTAEVRYTEDGEYCALILNLNGNRSKERPDPGSPYTRWDCGNCTESFDQRVGTDDPALACEAVGHDLSAKYAWDYESSYIVGGMPGHALYGPGSEVVWADVLCIIEAKDAMGADKEKHELISGTCQADGVGVLAAELCEGEEFEVWTDKSISIQSYLPVDAYEDASTDLEPSIIRNGDVNEPYYGTPLTIIRQNPRAIHPNPNAGTSGGVMS